MFPLVAMLSSFLSDSLDNVASWICSMGMGNSMVGGSEKDGNPKLSDSFFDSVEDRLSFGRRLLLAFGQGRGQGVCSVDPSPAVALRAVLEVPLFHEPAIASTILCNVVINNTSVNMFLCFCSNGAFTATSKPTSSFHRQKIEKTTHFYPRAEEVDISAFPETPKRTVTFSRRPKKERL